MKKENKQLAKKKKANKRKMAKIARGIRIGAYIAIPVIVIAVVIGLIVNGEHRNKINGSYGLTDDGYIENLKVSDYVTIGDLSGITVDHDKLVTDKMVQDKIDNYLDNNLVANKESEKVIADGDQVNIDFVGKIDGVEFENGSATNHNLTIGSETMIDGFEEQIKGHKAGDKFVIEVTFPSDYRTTSLRGKDATFDITVNSVYERPELNDEFVKENLKEYGSTVEELKEALAKEIYDDNLNSFVEDYLIENCKVSEIPSKYSKTLRTVFEVQYEKEFNYYNNLYYSYTGQFNWKDIYDYLDLTKEEYNKLLDETVEKSCKKNMILQCIFENEKLSFTEEDVKNYIIKVGGYPENSYKDAFTDYGKGFWYQNVLLETATKFVSEKVTVND